MVFTIPSDGAHAGDLCADRAIAAAKRGTPERVDRLLEAYRNYLQQSDGEVA